LLEEHELALQILATVNATLSAKGLMLKSGTAIDATLIAAPTSTKNSTGTRDPQMHQTKKGNQWYHGMKSHIGIDADSGLVHSVVGTAASVNDVTQAHRLVHGEETDVFADAGYQGVEKREETLTSCCGWVALSGNSELIVKRLQPVPMVVVASPGYWVTHGQPLAPEDLIQHQCLTYSLGKGGGVHPEWRFQRNGKAVNVSVRSHGREQRPSITVLRTGGPGRALPARAASQRGSGPPRAGAGAAGIRTHRHLAVHGLCPAQAQQRCTAHHAGFFGIPARTTR
jgi:hypothetical protein